MNRFQIFLVLCCFLLVLPVRAQESEASNLSDDDIEQLRQEVLQELDEIFDVEALDKTLEARQVAKNPMLIDSMNVYFDSIGIDFNVYTKLNYGTFWPDLLTGRKVYSINRKYIVDNLEEQPGRRMTLKIEFDTLESRNRLMLRPELQLNEGMKRFLEKHELSSLENTLQNFVEVALKDRKGPSPKAFQFIVRSTMDGLYTRTRDALSPGHILELQQLMLEDERLEEEMPHARADFQVTFAASPHQRYGFDAYVVQQWNMEYHFAAMGDGSAYPIAYKSLPRAPGSDEVHATFQYTPMDSIVLDSLKFTDSDGGYLEKTLVSQSAGKATYALTLSNYSTKTRIFAHHKGQLLGKLLVQPYQQQTKTLRIVPLFQSLNASGLEANLNEVFAPALIRWNVTVTEPFSPKKLTPDRPFTNPETERMKDFTEEMKAVRDEYLESNDIPKGTALIFAIPRFERADIEGYMPLGRGLGFIKRNSVTNGKTVAHELGHGLFMLDHSWEKEGPKKYSTTNLMDYTQNGTALRKAQWDKIQRPGLKISLFDKAEESALSQAHYWKTQTIIDALVKHNRESSFVFSSNGGYREVKSGRIGASQHGFSINGVKHDLVIETLLMDRPVNLKKSYVRVVEGRYIQVSFRDSKLEDVLQLRFKNMRAVEDLAAFMHRSTLRKAAEKELQEAVDGLNRENIEPRASAHLAALMSPTNLASLAFVDRGFLLGSILFEDDYWEVDGKNLLVELISTTPENEEFQLLKGGFGNANLNWFSAIEKQLGTFDNNDLANAMGLVHVLNQLIHKHYDEFAITPHLSRLKDFSFLGFKEYYYPSAQDFFFLAGENKAKYHLYGSFSVGFGNWNTTCEATYTKGKVHLEQQYHFENEDDYLYPTGADGPNRKFLSTYHADYHPFELVTVVFLQSYPALDYYKGDQLVVPAYMVPILYRATKNRDFQNYIHSIFNGIQIFYGITAMAATGGAAAPFFAAIAQAGGFLAILDEAITADLGNSVNAYDYKVKLQLYENWSLFKTTFDVIEIATGTGLGIARMPVGIRRINMLRAWKKFTKSCKEADQVPPVFQRALDEVGGAGISPNQTTSLTARVQAKLSLYPKVPDPRTGQNIILPHVEEIVPKADRVKWDLKARGEYIKKWYDKGYTTPIGGWDKYDIHHIKPREFGGNNDFWNLVPVERTTHQKEFNQFWRQFGGL